MQPRDTLTILAARLASSSPQVWADFLSGLAVYTDQSRDQLLKSPLQDLPVNQGRAQALAGLLELFKQAPANADKLKGNQK